MEELKKVVGGLCDIAKQSAEALSDGWQWTDAIKFVDEIASVPGIIKALPEARKQLKGLTSEQREELKSFFIDRFDIPNDATEQLVENAVGMLINLLGLIEQFKGLGKPS